mmetsp:Transcript_30940/g.89068  ORF Transcript_30940/g.89068 Transcript_30940/m.89068 type:complete len:206 (+) Transcript_30940:622-1239(+)
MQWCSCSSERCRSDDKASKMGRACSPSSAPSAATTSRKAATPARQVSGSSAEAKAALRAGQSSKKPASKRAPNAAAKVPTARNASSLPPVPDGPLDRSAAETSSRNRPSAWPAMPAPRRWIRARMQSSAGPLGALPWASSPSTRRRKRSNAGSMHGRHSSQALAMSSARDRKMATRARSSPAVSELSSSTLTTGWKTSGGNVEAC